MNGDFGIYKQLFGGNDYLSLQFYMKSLPFNSVLIGSFIRGVFMRVWALD